MKSLRQLARWPALAGLMLLLCCANLLAQFTDGDIAGTVTDPSGASIIGATVTIKNLQTGHLDKTQTDKIGYYHVAHLLPGTYQIRIEMSGFKALLLDDVAVNASQTTPANARLTIGAAGETVEVTEGAALVQTEEGRLDNTISTREVEDLPLNGRQVYQLVTEEPGVTATNAPVVSSVPAPTASVTFNYGFIANGSTPRGNNFVLDGTSNNNEWLGGTPLIYPSLDAIQEVQVQTLNFSAEYGRNNGAIVNVVTKSGTNDFHGNVFYSGRNTALNARNFYNSSAEKAPLRQNQFGFSFGGPIKKNDTFFFMDYEGSRLTDSLPALVVTETPYTRSLATPGSIAAMLFQDFPGPACLTPPGPTDLGCVAESPQIEPNRADQYLVRVDHRLGSNDLVFGRWDSTIASGDVARQELFGAGIRGFTAPFHGQFSDLATGYTHQFSPSTLNDFRFSFSRNNSHIGFGMPSGSETAQALQTAGLPPSDFAWLYFDDGTIPFGGELYVPRDFIFNDFKVNDTILHTAGRHAFRFGFEFIRIQENSDYRLYSAPFMEFAGIGSFAVGDAPYLEQATVNANYGSPAYGQFTDTPRHFRWNRWAAFVQDDWKLTPRFTLNLGLRWDVFANPTEANGKLSNIILGPGSDIFQQISTATVGRVSKLWNTNYHNFAPRIGLSWDPFGRGTTAIRSGFSIAYNEPFSNLYTNASRLNPPEANTAFVEPSIGIGVTDPIPYTFPFIPDPDFAAGPPTANGGIPGLDIVPNGVDPHLRSAYAIQWFLGVQHSFGRDYGFTFNYVGTRGVGGYTREDFNRFDGDVCNQTVCNYFSTRLNYGWGQITYISNESQSNYEGFNAQFRKTYAHNLMFTANYTFGKVLDQVTEGGLGDYFNTNGYGILYSGVSDIEHPHLDYGPSEFDVRHRFTLTGLWNIPGPKGSGVLNKIAGGWALNTIISLQSGRPFDVYCSQAWFNGCDFNMDGLAYDRPDRPAGIKTSAFSNSQFENGLFGNPTLNFYGFFSRTSAALETFCPNGLNSILDFGPINSGPGSQCVPVGEDGNLSRNAFRGPAFKDVDLSVVKTTGISDRVKVEFRADAFNIFNRVNLYNPIGDMSSPQFGISPAAFDPRQFQVGLKIMF
ncbi:MAG TPA: TonB-dependent receptor [Terriglobales bacterium]|nr:TonB-dependent receptor [Terriglobales bacterium]